MLTLGPKSTTVERVIKTPTGYVRATFLVVEFQGRIRAKLVSVAPVEAPEALPATVLALPGSVTKALAEVALSIGTEAILSPYVSFDFLTVQPTRGPSFA